MITKDYDIRIEDFDYRQYLENSTSYDFFVSDTWYDSACFEVLCFGEEELKKVSSSQIIY